MRGAAAEIFRSRSVDGPIAEDVGEIILTIGRSIRYPLSGAKCRPSQEAKPIVARGGEGCEWWRSVVAAVHRMLEPVLIGPTAGRVQRMILLRTCYSRREFCPFCHFLREGRRTSVADLRVLWCGCAA